MDSMLQLRVFLGWCTAINFGVLIFASIMLVAARGWASRIHGGMFGLGEDDVAREYFRYLANYKIAVVVFNLVPYIALRIMA